jgi:hypothetical protein
MGEFGVLCARILWPIRGNPAECKMRQGQEDELAFYVQIGSQVVCNKFAMATGANSQGFVPNLLLKGFFCSASCPTSITIPINCSLNWLFFRILYRFSYLGLGVRLSQLVLPFGRRNPRLVLLQVGQGFKFWPASAQRLSEPDKAGPMQRQRLATSIPVTVSHEQRSMRPPLAAQAVVISVTVTWTVLASAVTFK